MRRLPFYTVLLAAPLPGFACGDDSGSVPDDDETDGTDGTTSSGSGTTSTPDTDGGTTTTDTDGDTEGDPPPLTREHAGGQPSDIVIRGDHAFAAVGPRLLVWRMDGRVPMLIGESDPIAAMMSAVEVGNGTAFVTGYFDLDGKLHVYDVSNPASPTALGTAEYVTAEYSRPTDLVLQDPVLYLSDTETGIFALDISDPLAPVELAHVSEFGTSGLALAPNRLYHWASGFIGFWLGAVDSTSLTTIGGSGYPEALDAAVTPDHHVLLATLDGLDVYDAIDPDMPMSVFQSPDAVGRTVTVTDTHAYVPGEDGLHVVDLSNPNRITYEGVISAPTDRASTAASTANTLTTLTERGVGVVFDLTNKAAPIPTATFDLPGCVDCIHSAVSGDLLFVADFYTGLRIMNAWNLETVGRFEVDGMHGFEDVAVSENHAFVTDWASGLYVVDISDPGDPEQVGFVATGGYPSTVAVSGTHAYVGEGTGEGRLVVVDISAPTKPTVVGSLAVTKAREIALIEHYVLVADEASLGPGGLRVIDVSDPTLPKQAAFDETCSSALGVAVSADVAVLACSGDNSWHVVDVSDPLAPQKLADVAAPEGMLVWSVAVDGSRLYGGHAGGVEVHDLTNAANPSHVESRPTAWAVRGLTPSASHRVVAAAGLGGVYHFDVR